MKTPKKPISFEAAVQKAAAYCAFQERALTEVQGKLQKLGLNAHDQQRAVDWLIDQGFLNQERFVQSFVRGHFQSNGWGRVRIAYGLRAKQVPQHEIDLALEQHIDPEAYQQKLQSLFEQKKKGLKPEEPFKQKQKIIRFLLQRGFEPDLVYNLVNNHFIE